MRTTRHPNYQFVVIKDAATDFAILTRSTQTSDQTVEWTDGNTYPLITVETSSASHPFFTGTHRLQDSTGQIEKFKKRYAS